MVCRNKPACSKSSMVGSHQPWQDCRPISAPCQLHPAYTSRNCSELSFVNDFIILTHLPPSIYWEYWVSTQDQATIFLSYKLVRGSMHNEQDLKSDGALRFGLK